MREDEAAVVEKDVVAVGSPAPLRCGD